MAKLTLDRARKILGKLAEGISDEQISNDIRAAELLKNIFFDQLHTDMAKRSLDASTEPHNVP